MSNTNWAILIIAVAITVFIMWPRGTPATLPIIPGVSVVHDTVIVHDTIRAVKLRPEIRADTIILVDTVYAGNPDTAMAYSIEQSFERGAYVKASLSSRSFAPVPPADLKGIITYLPPIDSIHVINRTDTVPKIIYKAPVLPTWQTAVLGIAAGVVGGIWIRGKL